MDSLTLFVYIIEVILPRDLFPDFKLSYAGWAVTFLLVAMGVFAIFSKSATDFKGKVDIYIKPYIKKIAYFLMAWAFLHFLTGFVPDRGGAYKIAAAYGVQSIYKAATESEDVKRLASKSINVLESSLDKYLAGEEAQKPAVQEVTE